MITVTDLTEEYVDQTAALDARIFPDNIWGRDSFRNNILNDYDHPVVALDGKTVAGYGVLRQIDAGEILVIGVAPERRRQGIGRKLARAMLDRANQGENIFLEVREGNQPARRLYTSLGFLPVARRRSYYKDPVEDAVIMML